MLDCEHELAKLGVPIKTRHNEVAPSQYELAPIFENSNVGSDHQQLTMQILQNVARRYGLVCLLHEKPFAGVNGSGKHNNWSMGTDDGENLLEPGDTPHENLQFLFFCAAVIQAVNKHQGLLRASIASAGQDHRLGANEAPPAIISIFLGAELEKVFGAIERGEVGESTPESFLGLGTPVLPPMPMHGGDRNRTSPFAFTGNKFEFRALGSSMSLSLPNTVLNTIVAEAIDYLAEELEEALEAGAELEAALRPILQRSYAANKQIVFGGDDYSEEWHAEAEARGLLNLRATPDALPYLITDDTVTVFSNYGVLSKRELESRYEVFARAVRDEDQHRGRDRGGDRQDDAAAGGRAAPGAAAERPAGRAGVRDRGADLDAGRHDQGARAGEPRREPARRDCSSRPKYIRDTTIPAMDGVREAADALEKVVTDDLWPLPKYSEILFVK